MLQIKRWKMRIVDADAIWFDVIDPKTGEYPDVCNIALTEDWAKGLVYCDIDGFVIGEDGCLLLLDECGNYAYCPPDRFHIKLHMETEQ